MILEFEWVMRGIYREPARAIAAAIEVMLSTANVEVENRAVVACAVAWFRHGMDFAGHADDFVTFDVALRRRLGELRTQPTVVAP